MTEPNHSTDSITALPPMQDIPLPSTPSPPRRRHTLWIPRPLSSNPPTTTTTPPLSHPTPTPTPIPTTYTPALGYPRISIHYEKIPGKPGRLSHKDRCHYYLQRVKHSATKMIKKPGKHYVNRDNGYIPYDMPVHLRPGSSWSSSMVSKGSGGEGGSEGERGWRLLEVEVPSPTVDLWGEKTGEFTRVRTRTL
ncbi:hypothetical protein ACLMJK_005249 [Lecanora helva]